MKFLSAILRAWLPVWGLIPAFLVAQNGPDDLSLRDKATITYVAKNHIQNEYAQFLSLLSSGDLPPQDIEMLIERSYSPSFGQIFYNEKAVIEDNLDPTRNRYGQTQDLPVAQYLNNLVLFFSPDPQQYENVSVSNLRSSAVREEPFVNIDIAFEERFFGTHKDKGGSYQTQTRVATLRAVKDGRDWKTFIVNVVYQNPEVAFVEAEIMPEETEMTVAQPDSALRFASEGDSLRFVAMMRGMEENIQAQRQTLARILEELEVSFEAQEARKEEKYQDLIKEGEQALGAEDVDYAEKLFQQAGTILPFQLDHYRGLNQLRKMRERFAREDARITRQFQEQLRRTYAYERVRAYEQAREAVTQALALRPAADSLRPRLQRLEQLVNIEQGELTRFNAGDYEGSVDYFSDRLKQDEQNPFFYLSRGRSYVMLSKKRQALRDFESALALDATYKAVYLERARFLASLEAYDEALPDYNEAVRLDPTDPEVYASRAELRLRLNDRRGALEDLGTAIEQGKRAVDYLRRGELRWEDSGYEAAQEDFSAAIRQDSSLAYAWYRRGLTFEVAGELEEAAADFAEAKARGLAQGYRQDLSQVVDAYVRRGADFARQNELEQAVQAYQRALVLDPAVAEHWYELAQLFWRQRDLFSALDAYDEALELEPELAKAWEGRGEVEMEMARFEGAVEDFLAALQVDPQRMGGLMGAGKGYFALGDHAQARNYFERAVQRGPDFMLAHFELGRSHLALGAYELAVSAFDAAEKISKEFAGNYYQRARAYRGLGDDKAARKDLDEALRRDNGMVEAWVLRAEVLRSLEEPEAALSDYAQALALQPDPGVRLGHAQVAYQLNRHSEAARDLEALRESPLAQTVPVLQLDGMVQLRQGLPGAAQALFEAVLEKKPDHGPAFYGLGMSLVQLQDPEAGKIALAQAFRLGNFTQKQVKAEALLSPLMKDKAFKQMYKGLPKK